MSHAKNKVDWCLNKAQKETKEGKKHRGLIQTNKSKERALEHIAKAEHNLKVTIYLHQGSYTDWCSSSLFYTIYHCFLAIISKFGYESRNQECTFALIKYLIEDKKIGIDENDLNDVTSINILETHESSTALSIREEYQYSTKLSLGDKEYEKLLNLAKKILDKTKEIIEEY